MTAKTTDAKKKFGYPMRIVKDGESQRVSEGVCIHYIPVVLVLPAGESPTGERPQKE